MLCPHFDGRDRGPVCAVLGGARRVAEVCAPCWVCVQEVARVAAGPRGPLADWRGWSGAHQAPRNLGRGKEKAFHRELWGWSRGVEGNLCHAESSGSGAPGCLPQAGAWILGAWPRQAGGPVSGQGEVTGWNHKPAPRSCSQCSWVGGGLE